MTIAFCFASVIICTQGFLVSSLYRGPAEGSLLGFWPLDVSSPQPLADINNMPHFTIIQSNYRNTSWPSVFGDHRKSLTVRDSGYPWMVEIQTADYPWREMTLAFYMTTRGYGFGETGPIISFETQPSTVNRTVDFAIKYTVNGDLIIVHREGSRTHKVADMLDFTSSPWTFVGIRFKIPLETYSTDIHLFNEDGTFRVTLGSYWIDFQQGLYYRHFINIGKFRSGHSIQCLTIFRRMLEPVELSRLRCVCRKRGNCPSDGSPDVNSVYAGPFSGKLLGYWPFDSKTFIHEKFLPHVVQIEDMNDRIGDLYWGPFGERSTSYRSNSKEYPPLPLAHFSHDKIPFDKTDRSTDYLTIGCYFWTPYRYQDSNRTIFMKICSTKSIFKAPDISIIRPTNVERGRWVYLTILLDFVKEKMSYYVDGGELIEEWYPRDDSLKKENRLPVPYTKLKIAFLNEGERIACISLFNAAFDRISMDKMRCVCRYGGLCLEGWTAKRIQPFHGPSSKELVGFWPFDGEFYFDEAVRGLPPTSIGNEAKLVRDKAGPFGLTRTSYASSGNTYIATYDLRQIWQFRSKFTIAFYVLTTLADNTGETLVRLKTDDPLIFSVSLAINRVGDRFGIFFNDEMTGSSFWSFFGPAIFSNKWIFLAVTYNGQQLRYVTFNQDDPHAVFNGTVEDRENKFRFSSLDWQLKVGEMEKSRIACLIIYGKPLPLYLIAEQLPWVCKTKAAEPWKNVSTTSKPTSRPRSTETAPTSEESSFSPVTDESETTTEEEDYEDSRRTYPAPVWTTPSGSSFFRIPPLQTLFIPLTVLTFFL